MASTRAQQATVCAIGPIESSVPDSGNAPLVEMRLRESVSSLLAGTPVAETDPGRIEGSGQDPKLGNPAAPIRIVEYYDYQCPFSAAAAPVIRDFMKKHPDDVLLIGRDFPLESIHPDAMAAAVSARCVFKQGKADVFWLYHDLLFRQQDNLNATGLRDAAQSVGADLTAYDDCVATKATEAEVRASMADGAAAGVSGAPTFFVNTIRLPGTPTSDILEEIVRQLKTP